MSKKMPTYQDANAASIKNTCNRVSLRFDFRQGIRSTYGACKLKYKFEDTSKMHLIFLHKEKIKLYFDQQS